jgi:uncharacterized phiE125 gp8 family phage protein
MGLVLITAPVTEPVTLAEAKLQARVDWSGGSCGGSAGGGSSDDTLITALITAAREYVEVVTRRALVTQTWDYVLDEFPGVDYVRLPLPPLQSVTSITYKVKAGTVLTFAAANYVVATGSEPGKVILVSGCGWPSAELYRADPIRIQFVAGWTGVAPNTVPVVIKQAILLLVGHLYENREAVAEVRGGALTEIPLGVDALLATHRVRGF